MAMFLKLGLNVRIRNLGDFPSLESFENTCNLFYRIKKRECLSSGEAIEQLLLLL
ncbi:unnamed protein product [Brassica rapa]|uniref:Uncharacterized protein n=2 Tax=Brassica TaxID=3705 RepID=A0A8D9I1L6_BRACM|nr:unnamed protein product [Brassica napus]CAG7909918.1 unnamed protein product [Brassica rapa]